MNIHHDDPRWTAYVLGELNDADRAEIERELESSPEARELVDEIRMMTILLTDELAKEGITLIDSTRYTTEHLTTPGVLTRRAPSESQWSDIRFGWDLCKTVSRLDSQEEASWARSRIRSWQNGRPWSQGSKISLGLLEPSWI